MMASCAQRKQYIGTPIPPLFRCPTCHISTKSHIKQGLCLNTWISARRLQRNRGAVQVLAALRGFSLFISAESVKMEFEDVGNGRFLILTDSNQQFPTERLKVLKAEMKKSSSGKEYPLLTLIGETSGNEFQIACYSRDVKDCVTEWGKNPESWGYITFKTTLITNRRSMVPCKNQNPNEEVIQ